MFTADVLQRNEFSFDRFSSIGVRSTISNKLDYFSPIQLNMIEGCYELLVHGNLAYLTTTQQKSCLAFGKQYRSKLKRMIGIMENIIENNGEFKP